MAEKIIKTVYEEFLTDDELLHEDKVLLAKARKALNTSYAPYSHFQVSCTLLLEDNSIIEGTNQENAVLSLGLCAEQNALSTYASYHREIPIVSMAITAHHNSKILDAPVSPCGACREVIREFEDRQGNPIRMILQAMTGPVWIFNGIESLLPFPFKRDQIGA